MTKTPETLEAKLEHVVREYLTLQQAAATAAVARVFETMMPTAQRVVSRQQASYTRRAPSAMAELAERLFAAVQACPGETMTVFAARLGQSSRTLVRPMSHLKRSGRVRSAGERNFTRYFPMTVAGPA